MGQSASKSKEKWEEFLEAECDGSGPHAMYSDGVPETRRMETGGGAGIHLCYACYRREIKWRELRNQYQIAYSFQLPVWQSMPLVAAMEAQP